MTSLSGHYWFGPSHQITLGICDTVSSAELLPKSEYLSFPFKEIHLKIVICKISSILTKRKRVR